MKIIYIFIFILIYILFRILFSYLIKLFNKKENLNNLNNLKYTLFEPSGNIAYHYGNKFKYGNMNLNAYPNVEIIPNKPLFNNNKFLPECCFYYNDYSTSKGCPCITPDQQYYLQRRGINRHESSLIQEGKSYKNIYYSPRLALKGEEFPFNPLTSSEYNIYISPEFRQDDLSINEFYSYTNNSSYETENDGLNYNE
tara:strand:- start:229 stop:819 length:591 start_codon:yes stop_codon:yes gene_type:complete